MEQDIFNLNNKIYSNNNNILLEIIKDLQTIINNSKDNIIIKILSNVIIKLNNIINENQKNFELIRKDISMLYTKLSNHIDTKFNELKNNNKEVNLNNNNTRYIFKVVNNANENNDELNNNGHTGLFSKGGVNCPGSCCPSCKKMGNVCKDGGRYQCCGLCKDCGLCLFNDNGHTGLFSKRGVNCPGSCCPSCKKMGNVCKDGGRYQCCGLCIDCGYCLNNKK